MNSKELAIKIEGLSKRYYISKVQSGGKSLKNFFFPEREVLWALKNISFELRYGEVLGLIGHNGAGKSTLLKVLSKITDPTEGYAKIYGRVGALLEVGTGFHPEFSGRENIYFSGSILGMKKREIDDKFDEIVSFSEVGKFIDTPVKRYSSGMYVRLAFAVAAHLQPEIMLIDEVLAVGDIDFQEKCIGKMKDVTKLGKAILVVSHSMGTIKALCSRAILLNRGEMKLDCDVDRAINEYRNIKEADASEKIISKEDHISGGDKIQVKKVCLLNGVLNSFSVYWKQSISINVEVEALEDIEEVSFGAGIKMLDETVVFTVHHNDYGLKADWTFKPGRYNIKFIIKNDLKPGVYKLILTAHQKHHSKNLFYMEAVNIEILEHSENKLIPLAYNPGLINGSVRWDELESVSYFSEKDPKNSCFG